MHTTPPIIVLNTIKSTQQRRKQNTRKRSDETEDERTPPWCDWSKTHSDLECLLSLPEETLYLPITVSQMIPKAGKVGNTQDKLIWRKISMLSVTTGLLLSCYPIVLFWEKEELYSGLVKFLELQKKFKRNDQPRCNCPCWCQWKGPSSNSNFTIKAEVKGLTCIMKMKKNLTN